MAVRIDEYGHIIRDGEKATSTNNQREDTEPNPKFTWGWVLICIAGLFILFTVVFNILPGNDRSEQTRAYEQAPSWVNKLGIRRARTIKESNYYLDQNQVMMHNITAPYTGTYVFTTLDSGDTYGFLSSSDDSKEETYNDDDGGIDNNFMIVQNYNEGERMNIRVRFLDPNTMSGKILFYVFLVEEWQ